MGVPQETITPIEEYGGVFLKRDDLYVRGGACGGKARTCWHLATSEGAPGLIGMAHTLQPAKGLVTATARSSMQAQIVARVAHVLGVPARCHMPTGAKTEEMSCIEDSGGQLVQHRGGYTNVLVARAKADCGNRPGWRYIPFGLEDWAAVHCTKRQVQGIPPEVSRIVICIGSGMSAAGVLWGLQIQKLDIPVLGVRVGADPTRRLDKYAPARWRAAMEIVGASVPYAKAIDASIGGVVLNAHYEAKCLEHVRHSDLLWVVGTHAVAPLKGDR